MSDITSAVKDCHEGLSLLWLKETIDAGTDRQTEAAMERSTRVRVQIDAQTDRGRDGAIDTGRGTDRRTGRQRPRWSLPDKVDEDTVSRFQAAASNQRLEEVSELASVLFRQLNYSNSAVTCHATYQLSYIMAGTRKA